MARTNGQERIHRTSDRDTGVRVAQPVAQITSIPVHSCTVESSCGE